MKVVGIAGQARNGKDTLADYLAAQMNQRYVTGGAWKRASFASAVKKCFCDYFGKDLAFVEEWKLKPEIPPGLLKPVRQSLQFIGDGFRQIQDDIWIETAFRFNAPPFILSDARYFNEARAIKKNGGLNILMWRPSFENADPNPSESQIKPVVDWCVGQNKSGVISQWVTHFDQPGVDIPEEVKLFDIFVRNEGDKDDLHRFADTVIVPYLEQFFKGTD